MSNIKERGNIITTLLFMSQLFYESGIFILLEITKKFMYKKLIIIIGLLVILFVLGIAFRTPSTENVVDNSNVMNNDNTSSTTNQDANLVVSDSYETKTMDIADDYVKFSVKYPSFKLANADFNSQIENLLKAKIEDHKKASKEYWQARYDTQAKGDNFPKIPATEADKLYFTSDFTVVQSNDSYISFVLNISGFSGGAHGYATDYPFNYDVKNQKPVTLADLFPNDPKYLNYLSATSRIFLKTKFTSDTQNNQNDNSDPKAMQEYVNNMISMIDSGTEPKEENFSVFTFTPDKIKIYFAQYQVGPYSNGMPEVEMVRE